MQNLVTVFGGAGFVGRQVVRALAKRGWRVRVAARNAGRGYRLRMLGDVGQISIVQANIRDEASVARALDGASACINLVGVGFESGPQSFEAVHVQAAGLVARIAHAKGVKTLVQMSAIGADAHSPSAYGRTKAAGEAAVKHEFPDAVIIRPSVIFGPDDNFFNRFGRMATISPALPLIGGGETRFAPVFVGDVAAAIVNALSDPGAAGVTFELGGPTTYSFRELMQLVLTETGRKSGLAPLPFQLSTLLGRLAALSAMVGIAPMITADQVELFKADNLPAAGAPGLEALGVTPTAVEAIVPAYLYRYRRGGQYAPVPAGAY